jgi:hypothetical protein
VDVAIDVPSMAVRCREAGVEVPLTELTCGGKTYRVTMEDNPLVQWLLHRKGHIRQWLLECLVELHEEGGGGEGRRAVLWPMKERADKAEANDVRVIEATLATITDKVTLDDLLPTTAKEETREETREETKEETPSLPSKEKKGWEKGKPTAGEGEKEERKRRLSDCGKEGGAFPSSPDPPSADCTPASPTSTPPNNPDAEAGRVSSPRRPRKRAAPGGAGNDHPVPSPRSSARVAARAGGKGGGK